MNKENSVAPITNSIYLGITIQELASITQSKVIGNSEILGRKLSTLTTDSRNIKENCIFVALQGENFDGHNFILSSFEKGALCAIAHNEPDYVPEGHIVLICDNTINALLKIAANHRKQLDIPVVAITGSVGKTTTKEFLSSILSQKYVTGKTQKNNNNEIGMPLSILSYDKTIEVLVLEMGMMGMGEIELLSTHAKPNISIITNIGTAHIGFPGIGSRENIKIAKLEILKGMDENSTIILNGDDSMLWAEKGKTKVNQLFYGINNRECDVIAENINIYSYGSEFDIIDRTNPVIRKVHVKIPVAGKHVIYDALSAYTAGVMLKLSDENIITGFANFENTGMRLKMFDWNNSIIIEDCYNASPESMKSSLDVLVNMDVTQGKKIAVIGDMLGLGDYAKSAHLDIGTTVSKLKVDVLFAYGEFACDLKEGALSDGMNMDCIHTYDAEHRNELVEKIRETIKKDDIVLFKASRPMCLESVVEELCL